MNFLFFGSVRIWCPKDDKKLSQTTIIKRFKNQSELIDLPTECIVVKSNVCTILASLLPSASEGWGKVIFSLCVSVHTLTRGEYPIRPRGGGEVPRSREVPRSGWGGTPSNPGWKSGQRGYPHP